MRARARFFLPKNEIATSFLSLTILFLCMACFSTSIVAKKHKLYDDEKDRHDIHSFHDLLVFPPKKRPSKAV